MATKTPSSSKKAKPKSAPAKRKATTRAKATPTSPTSPKSAPAKSARENPRAIAGRPAQARSPLGRGPAARPTYVPRAMPVLDDDDVLMAHGAGGGAGYGRCGGRMLGSMLEQQICDRLGQAGVAHSHSPRHFEVTLAEKQVGAYAPMIVLRGRGREGKSVVVESAEDSKNPILPKVIAFRRQYGQEYYVIFVAPDEVLDDVELATYDEACAVTDVGTLISRLAE